MKNASLFFLAMFSTVSFHTSNKWYQDSIAITSKQSDSLNIYGNWKIIKFVPAPVSEITIGEAKKYIGKIISLNPNLVIVVADTCNNPFFEITEENSNEYFLEHRMDKAMLKINSDNIKIVTVGCNNQPKYFNKESPYFLYDFIIDKDLLMVSFKGFYFYLKKTN